MSEDHQNLDTHDCLKGYVLNRVGGNHLPTDKSRCSLNNIENGQFIFDKNDHLQQRLNYMILIQRIITKDIRCLQGLSDSVIQHISHPHSSELSKKSEMVCHKAPYVQTTLCLILIKIA